MWLITLAIVVLAFIRLSHRIDELERALSTRDPGSAADAVTPSLAPTPAPFAPTQAAASSTEAAPPRLAPSWSGQFASWLKEDFLMKLGAFLVLLGFAWFITYAFAHEWIGPLGQITLGLLLGAFVLAFGFWRIARYANQGSVLVALGSSVVLITVFAARNVYDIFTPLSATAMMLLSVAFVALAAVRFRVRMLAFVGLLLAGIVPLLVHGSTDYVGLFSYLALITLGVLWVVLITEWRDLLVGALLLLSLYSVPHWLRFTHQDIDTLLLYAYGFAVVFFVANIAGFIRAREITQANIVGAAWNGIFLLLWILVGVAKEWQSLVLSFWTVAFLGAAFVLARLLGNLKPFYSYAAVGVLFLGAATAAELDGATLGIAFTIEAAIVVLLAHLLVGRTRVTEVASFLFVIPGAFVLRSVMEYPAYFYGENSPYAGYYYGQLPQEGSLFHSHFALILLYSLVTLALGFALRKVRTNDETKARSLPGVFLLVGSAFSLVLVWLFAHQALASGSATLISLAIYTVVGIVLHMKGREHGSRAIRLSGTTLIGFVVIHLFLVDVWNLELFWRIIAFLLVGALLMATAFIGKRSGTSLKDML